MSLFRTNWLFLVVMNDLHWVLALRNSRILVSDVGFHLY